MDRNMHLACLRRDAADLLAAGRRGLGAQVPACPGWSVERLVGHVGRVYRSTAVWVATGEASEVERAPTGEAVLEWTARGLDELLPALEAGSSDDPDATVAVTWAGQQPASFWPRRMAVETALHRWDAQDALGDPSPIDAALAVDGVDEMFDVLLPERAGGALTGDGESLHLHATDVPGEWMVTLTAGRPIVERAHGKGTVAVRGPASSLLLLLWNRGSREAVDVFGDGALLERWARAVTL
jgi:uncharacterized protein (TIGR03083 family)